MTVEKNLKEIHSRNFTIFQIFFQPLFIKILCINCIYRNIPTEPSNSKNALISRYGN